MDAEQVVEKILADANGQAEQIKIAADQTQAAEKAKLDEQLSEFKKQSQALAQKAQQETKEHLLAAVRMEIAKQGLAEKRAVLDEVFVQAQSQMQKLDDKSYRKLMARLIGESIETGDEEVIVDKADSRIDAEFIQSVNQKLGGDLKGNLRLSGERRDLGGGGFVLKRGDILTNASLDVLLEQVRKELEMELAGELFG
jgi:V/A-type H+-transporting ATPase subunit E